MAASGLRSRMESLDLVANNVANAATGGYKQIASSIAFMSLRRPNGDPDTAMPVIERP